MTAASLIGVLAVTVGLVSGWAQAASKKVDQSNDAKEAILKLEHEWETAIVKRDIATVEAQEADDYIAIHADGVMQTKKEENGELRSGDVIITFAKMSDIKVRVYGDAAADTGKLSLKGKTKGKEWAVDLRFTDVWVKRDGRWQCVSSQGTTIANP